MTPEKEAALRATYPTLFDVPKNYPISYGVEIDDGWYTLVDRLCGLIVRRTERDKTDLRVVQIKEKFGGLRFYVSFLGEQTVQAEETRSWVYGAITLAESMSYTICEQCGHPGEHRTDGWHRTLCQQHEDERESRRTK